jgi:hypothetical protein
MKAQFLTALFVIAMTTNPFVWGEAVESFGDGDFTSNPAWTGDVSSWEIVADSDVAAGASNSNTLRLAYGVSESGQQFLATQRMGSWGTEQSWSFWMGRRNQAATNSNYSIVWLWASTPNLTGADVHGYRVRFGDNTDDDNIFLEREDGNFSSVSIITSEGAVPNGLTDFGFLVRVTRTSDSVWTLYTSLLPTASGEGAVATTVPTVENTSVFQGIVTDAAYTDFADGYWGVAAVHSSAENPRSAAEFDQFYFEISGDASLPVELSQFTATRTEAGVRLRWRTESEINNLGFWIYRSDRRDGDFVKVNATMIPGAGTSGASNVYEFIDTTVEDDGTYYYYLEDVALDGSASRSRMIQLRGAFTLDGKLVLTWGRLKRERQ